MTDESKVSINYCSEIKTKAQNRNECSSTQAVTVIKKSIVQCESHFEVQVDTFMGSQQVGEEPELTAMPNTIDQNREQVHPLLYDCQ